MKKEKNTLLPSQHEGAEEIIKQKIFVIRGYRVMIDYDLAELYGVVTKRFNEQIKRNSERFPNDFMFQLTKEEHAILNRSQFATGSQKHRDQRFLPYVFTEHGVAMLSSVLNSERAVLMSIFIIRAFIKMKESLDFHKDLAIKIAEIERTQKEQGGMLQHVHAAVKHLIEKPAGLPRKIGFKTD